MILEESEVLERFESPLNLLNRLKNNLSKKTVDSNGRPQNIIPFLPPTTDQIIEDVEDKLKHGGLKSKAAAIMSDAMDELHKRLPEVQRPEKLASIAAEMNKVIGDKVKDPEDTKHAQIIIYAPQHRSETHFEVITVNE